MAEAIRLREYQTCCSVRLAASERDTLRALVPDLTVQPSAGSEGAYDITPASTVGVVRIGDQVVEILPKLPLDRVLFLVSYGLDPRSWRDDSAPLIHEAGLVEALVPTFAQLVQQALRRGPLQGYVPVDESLVTIRGRVRFADQFRRRTGLPLPVEVHFDEFTEDILENRLLRAATDRLLRLRSRHPSTRQALLRLRELFSGITSVRFGPEIPEPQWTRLNGHYRPAVNLARLILRDLALETRSGGHDATALLFDMNRVFETFVHAALRERLGLGLRNFPRGSDVRPIHLDTDRRIRLKPDLSWWYADRCVWVGDCKYKRTTGSIPNSDLYQLHAYLTALGLDDGLLVYAAGEHVGGSYAVRHASKRLHVRTLDLAGSPGVVLDQIRDLGHAIQSQLRPVSGPQVLCG